MKAVSLTCVKEHCAFGSGGMDFTATPQAALWPHPADPTRWDVLKATGTLGASLLIFIQVCTSPRPLHSFILIADSWHPTSYVDSCFCCLHFGQTFSNSFWSMILQFLTQLLTQLSLTLDCLLITGFISNLILKFCYKERSSPDRIEREKYSEMQQNYWHYASNIPLFFPLKALSDNP